MLAPTEGQLMVMSRLPKMIERGQIMDAIFRFGDVLETLIADPEDRQYAYEGLATETIASSEFLDLLVKVLDRFLKPTGDAPRTGPAPKKRAARARR